MTRFIINIKRRLYCVYFSLTRHLKTCISVLQKDCILQSYDS